MTDLLNCQSCLLSRLSSSPAGLVYTVAGVIEEIQTLEICNPLVLFQRGLCLAREWQTLNNYARVVE